ncbi:hypothetical protein [Psychrobacter sp. P2G3]|uniref:hypothetical protein n=1 Tax=Psychrobacter sp. P2G3 TaxID=1699622 RepID=UPI00078CD7BB|nr:hypothetical protein [Psychrobacter sp. P2G3]AMN49105.1 hypothetical protein AK823_03745 [Psychrobacter sp. P2G3]
MILIHNALINNIKRSEAAYKVYQQGLTYHQALHIFHANEKIYEELNFLLNNNNIDMAMSKKIFNYIFYLEDWFLQFSKLENDIDDIEDRFSFVSLKHSIVYPSSFLDDVIQ